MTDPADHIDRLDDAAAAAVDGVADPEQLTLLAEAADGPERIAAQRLAKDAVADPPPGLSTDVAESALQAALGAFNPEARPAAGIVEIHNRPRSKRARWIAPAAAAAAALLLVLGIAGALRSGSDGARSDLASAPTAAVDALAGEDAAGGAASSGVAESNAPQSLGSATVLDGGDLGRINDPAELAQRIADALDGATRDQATVRAGAPEAEVATCAAKAGDVAPLALGPLHYRARGTYEGAAVVALAYDRADRGGRILLLLDARTCELVTDQDF